ncbi:MAG: hypothetical protein JNG86_15180, partial [Verrucomicrobiaceae bacterium]|nr:hypothetical protein [Verrucomicrobiaceae bacterium]
MRSVLFFLTAAAVFAQTAGVPVYQEGRGARSQAALMEKAKALLDEKALVPLTAMGEQMKRASCELTLPPADTKPLSGRERWQRARAAHL